MARNAVTGAGAWAWAFVALPADHRGWHSLSHKRAARRSHGADDDRAADLYEMTQQMTAAAGLPAYEISNHAAAGEECQHNLTYWQAGDWLGIGQARMAGCTF